MVSTVELGWRLKTTDSDDQDGFHDHDPVMIIMMIMMIMMVMTMKKADDMIDDSYNDQDPVRYNVCDAG